MHIFSSIGFPSLKLLYIAIFFSGENFTVYCNVIQQFYGLQEKDAQG
jgi:hypothetical protein